MTTNGSAQQLVVIGVDGSAESVAALEWAAGYARGCGAKLRAILAWHYPAAAGVAPIGKAPKEISDEVRTTMAEALDKSIAAGAPGLDIEQKIGYGHPSQVLVDASQNADLLVVGSRGRGAFTGMLVGSVSLYCVTHARCPVVVVRTH